MTGRLGLLLLFAGLVLLFVAWDLVFCHGQRSRGMMSRVIEIAPGRYRPRRPPRP